MIFRAKIIESCLNQAVEISKEFEAENIFYTPDKCFYLKQGIFECKLPFKYYRELRKIFKDWRPKNFEEE